MKKIVNRILKKGFKGNLLLRRAGVPPDGGYTPERLLEIAKCSKDPQYFFRTYVKIKHVDYERKVLFDPRGYQLEMLHSIIKNRNTVSRWPRQSGKTTVIAAVALHAMLFTFNYSILIAAHKGDKAREIVGTIEEMYMELPSWLQQGVLEWNKGSFKLENGSRVRASTTSISSARGDTYNCIMLDEFAFVASHIAEEFLKSVIPTVSSGKDTKIIITSTPKGLNMFYKVWEEAVNIKAGFRKTDDFVPIAVEWDQVPGRDENFRAGIIKKYGQEFWDQEFACAFLGSSRTLISSAKLLTMASEEPLKYTEQARLYAEPEPGHVYAMTVDVSEGLGGDFSVLMVFDVTTAPYRPVYIYQDRYIDPYALPGLIYEIAKIYNEAMVLVECNFGQLVAKILWEEFEYDHIISTERNVKSVGGFSVGWGAKRQVPGVFMSPQVKRMGCSALKSLVENDQLIIRDSKTIDELKRFAVKGKSYEAEQGNDDLAMALVMFGWLSEQGYLRHQVDANVRNAIVERNQQRIDDNMIAVYHNNNQPNNELVVAKGDDDSWLWKNDDPEPDQRYLDDLGQWEKHGWN